MRRWMMGMGLLLAGALAQPSTAEAQAGSKASYVLGADISGSFYDPAQNGHGFVVEHIVSNGTPAVLVTWFTFLDGQQRWLVGVGPASGSEARIPLSITLGGDFPPRFNPASVSTQPWGELTLRFSNKNAGRAIWTTNYPGFASGEMPIQRLTQPASTHDVTTNQIASCHAGSWYDPAQTGHGVFIEVLGDAPNRVMLAFWYAYLNGEQRWMAATGPIQGASAALTANLTSGADFPPDFNPASVSSVPWGTMTFRAIDANNAQWSWNSTVSGFGSGSMNLQRLTSLSGSDCGLTAGAVQDLAWAPENQWPSILDSMVSAGVHSIRMDFRWYMIEPQRGVWNFGLHDRLVAAVRARGIRVLGILNDVPTWANGQSGAWSGTYPPSNVVDWSNYVGAVVGHYSETVEAWELWNEENIALFFRPVPDAAQYVALLRAGYTAAKAADPDAIIVLGGLAGNGVVMGWEPDESRNFLQKIYAAGGGGYFDVVAIHPYVHPGTAGTSALTQFVRDTRAVMNANSDSRPIWLTEIGWPTAVDAWGGPTVSEDQMAQWVTAVLGDCSGLGAGVDRAYWYSFRDTGVDQTDLENSFGLIRFDLAPKPALFAFRRLADSAFCDPRP